MKEEGAASSSDNPSDIQIPNEVLRIYLNEVKHTRHDSEHDAEEEENVPVDGMIMLTKYSLYLFEVNFLFNY